MLETTKKENVLLNRILRTSQSYARESLMWTICSFGTVVVYSCLMGNVVGVVAAVVLAGLVITRDIREYRKFSAEIAQLSITK